MKIHFSINLKDNGAGGPIFRWTDPSNYYWLEINSKGFIFKRMANGYINVIQQY